MRERERERVCDFVTAAVLCRAGVKINEARMHYKRRVEELKNS
jgi:hypothetical protein